MNLTREDWSLGWIPCDDEYNGRPNGLLRMDNLCLNERGSLSLMGGTERVSNQLSGDILQLYSKYLGSTKYRYAVTSDGKVYRNNTEIIQFSPIRVAFGTSYGEVLICAGDKRKADNGSNIYDIGIPAPSGPPGVERKEQPILDISGSYSGWQAVENQADNIVRGSDYVQFDTKENFGVIENQVGPFDTNSLPGNNIGTPEDTFSFYIRIGDTSLLEAVVIQLGSDSDHKNYFQYRWNNDDQSPFTQGINAWTRLETRRKDFEVVGNPDWEHIIYIRVQLVVAAVIANNVVNEFRFRGGSKGPLNGIYSYCQIYVRNNGSTCFKSKPGPIAENAAIVNGAFTITPHTEGIPSYVNEIWIYRRSGDIDADWVPLGERRKLERWYRVKVLTPPFSAFDDNLSDEDVMMLDQSDFWINEYLITISDIPDAILDMETNFCGRNLYMTFKEIYISSLNDPSAIDPRFTIKLSGNPGAKNLWIRKVSNNACYVATTEDIYEISGTLVEQPDGTIDVYVRSLGVKYPPLSHDVAVDGGTVYYVAADGIRALSGTSSLLISENLNLLFQGHERYGFKPILLLPLASAVYPIALAKNRLWVSLPLTNDERWVFVFDATSKAWYPYYTNPISLFSEEDGILIAGYAESSGRYIRQIDKGNSYDGIEKLPVKILTIYDSNNQPRNRKDVFTLKVTADTGNEPVTIYISKDGGTFINLGSYKFDGKQEHLIEIATKIGLGFRYALRFEGSFNRFELYNFTIEYEPRPEQLNYLRIPNTNLGTLARKRFVSYAFVIDTLGNSITFTPYVDNTALSSSTVNKNYKGTYIHFFTSETIGTDIGGILSGGTFEFYGLNLEETVSEKLPTPTKYLVIPADDYGTPNRKRHSSYKFQINTRGKQVRFTPKLDGVTKAPLIFSTDEKRTVEYFFTEDTIAIDIGGILESLEDTEFEFYGVIRPQHIEVLPPRLKEFRVPNTNYGIAAKKRIRTMPMIIDTYGYNVSFIPIVDGVAYTPSTINTQGKKTAFHYFTTDVFGIDYGAEIVGSNPFEFYELLKPESVEVLPVGKKFDQVGPVHFNRLGKIIGFRVRLIATGNLMEYKLYAEDVLISTGEFVTYPNQDYVYEIEYLPKSKHTTVCRLELKSTDDTVFHRYYVDFKVNIGGDKTQIKLYRFPSPYDQVIY